jgi:dolichyl-phosphate beta-glucosyltransferase
MLELSIVIPAYNEANKIGHDILAAATFLQENRMAGEVIVVDDGSSDDTAAWAQKVRLPRDVTLKVIRLERNRGKGHAVRTGILQSTGKVVMFADCGSCIPYPQALDGLALLEKKACQVAVGSRRSVDSTIVQNQSLYRRLCSLAFRVALRILLPELRHLDDTQCGFKLYEGSLARTLFAQARIDGFLFDVEVLVLAERHGAKICQFPVLWTCDRDSRLSAAQHSKSVLRELWAIRKERDTRRDHSGQAP